MRIAGDYQSDKAELLNLRLNKCDSSIDTEVVCKSDEEILEFFRNKFFFVIKNEKLFDANKYGLESIVEQCSFTWVPINTQVRQSIPFKISMSTLFLQDKNVDLDEITEVIDNSMFKVDQIPVRSFEKNLIV